MTESINFVLSSDNNYVDKLTVCMYSILEVHKCVNTVNIHVLSNNISTKNIDKIKETSRFFNNANVIFYDFEDIERKIGMKVNVDHLSLAAYSRLFIPDILSLDIHRALYLDVDILVERTLLELFDLELKGNWMAGVKSILDLPTADDINEGLFHINSGVILWDLDVCRREQFTKKALEFIKDRDGNLKFHDQTVINNVCLGKILPLSLKYNVISGILFLDYEKFIKVYALKNYYDKITYQEAQSNPSIIHLTSWVVGRPWEKICYHPYKKKYENILDKTEFRNYEKTNPQKSKYNFVKIWMYKNFSGVVIRDLTNIKKKIKKNN